MVEAPQQSSGLREAVRDDLAHSVRPSSARDRHRVASEGCGIAENGEGITGRGDRTDAKQLHRLLVPLDADVDVARSEEVVVADVVAGEREWRTRGWRRDHGCRYEARVDDIDDSDAAVVLAPLRERERYRHVVRAPGCRADHPGFD